MHATTTRQDPRLDFFAHLLKRLCGRSAHLRQAPLIYGNHLEYLETWLPMIVEDAVAGIKEEGGVGGMILQCQVLSRWSSPFYLAVCESSRDTRLHGNELISIQDSKGRWAWGITKRGMRSEATGNATVEVVILADELPVLGRWMARIALDTNSHLREYVAVQSLPKSPLAEDILGISLVKKKKSKKVPQETEIEADECLNSSQQAAVQTAIGRSKGVTLIQGPPGTGKTRTIASILDALKDDTGGILVCAPSNTAVDELISRLDVTKRKIIRVGAYGRGLSCKEVLLSTVAAPSQGVVDSFRKIEKQSIESGAGDAAALGWHSYEVDGLLDERDAYEWRCKLEETTIKKQVLLDADIVLCTLSMAACPAVTRACAAFRTVIIDEAGQSVEPSTLIPLAYGCTRLVLVGDPCQLPATVLSMGNLSRGYGRSMFERLKEAGMPVHLLDTQYRMHPAIRSFPGRYFYEDKLRDNVSDLWRPHHDHWFSSPYLFFNIPWGCEAMRGTSVYNEAEARLAAALLRELRGNTVILTAYRAQVERLRQEISDCDIATVDGYQGKETDAVILSCVRTGTESLRDGCIGFVSDRRRMNVALTRARHTLWVIGNADALRMNADWEELILDAERRDLIIDVLDGDPLTLRSRVTGETHALT